MPEHDVYFIEAPTRQAAKWAAWRLAKRNGDAWYAEIEDDFPLRGVKVEDVTDIPDEIWAEWPENLRSARV